MDAVQPIHKPIKSNAEAVRHLREIVVHFESGYIANPSARAEGLRGKCESKLNRVIAFLETCQTNNT